MAIKTVTNENLAQYVADRTAAGSKIATGEEQVAIADAAVATGAQTEGAPTPGNPVIKPGVAETTNTGPDPGNAKPSGKPPEKPTPVQQRIDELTRQRKEMEEFAEEEYGARLRAEARVAALETELAQGKPKAEEPKREELKRPSPKDFETQDAYDAAMEVYDAKRDERTRESAIAETRRQDTIRQQNQQMVAKINQAKSDIPDWQDVIDAADANKRMVPPHIQAAIFESDVGGHLAYELAKDKDLEARIFKLPAAKALLELGKLEDKIQTKYKPAVTTTVASGAAPPTVETTRAPAPITPIRGNGDGGEIPKDLSKPMSFADYKAARLASKRNGRAR